MKNLNWFIILIAVIAGLTACEKKSKNNTVAVPPYGQEQCIYNAQTGQYISNVTGQYCTPQNNWYNNQNWNNYGQWNYNYAPVQPLAYSWVNYSYQPIGCNYGLIPYYDDYTRCYYCKHPNYNGFNAWLSFHINGY